MLSKEDSVYLNDKDYNMPLEKFFVPEIYAEGDRVSGNGTVCKAYPFSNEDLPRMFENINNSKSRVLTVGSSGDQFLNAVYYGAKDITVLDGNLFTKPYIDYKVAAIKNLTYEEFRYYFLLKKDPFCRAVYSKIFQDLPEDSQEFFGTIFLEQSNSKDTYNAICHKDDVFDEQIQSLFFAEPSSYMKLQDKLLKNDYGFQVINAEFADFNKARNRLVFEELLTMQLLLLSLKNKYKNNEAGIKFNKDVKMSDIINDLPFNLTKAQLRVLEEIDKDMESDEAMNRLLQGDVGSGKTIVAIIAAYKAVKSGYQMAIMAPTSILATQHLESFEAKYARAHVNGLAGISIYKSGEELNEIYSVIDKVREESK
mgnify:CR=1 FL=1